MTLTPGFFFLSPHRVSLLVCEGGRVENISMCWNLQHDVGRFFFFRAENLGYANQTADGSFYQAATGDRITCVDWSYTRSNYG